MSAFDLKSYKGNVYTLVFIVWKNPTKKHSKLPSYFLFRAPPSGNLRRNPTGARTTLWESVDDMITNRALVCSSSSSALRCVTLCSPVAAALNQATLNIHTAVNLGN